MPLATGDFTLNGITYKKAGVNIDEGEKLVTLIKPFAKATSRPEVMAGIGGFGALFSLNLKKYKNPVLVSSTDGVGTKLKIAFMLNKHDTVGIDLVAMGVNDLIVSGAEPLFFLDYFATGRLNAKNAASVIKGIALGCKEAGCALVGGETAEMPGFYDGGEYDLAGFVVGIVEKDKIIDGSAVKSGDAIIGLSSSGLHSNGYSLARKVLFDKLRLKPESKISGFKRNIGEELLAPTKIYVKAIKAIQKKFNIKGIAHITGGGLIENVPRVMPNNCKAVIYKNRWKMPFIFRFIQDGGKISEIEMFRTFNCGIGMVLIASKDDADGIIRRLKTLKQNAFFIGEIEKRTGKENSVVII
ncbi:MAG: phosphoribosylformylglycinamidine cyclo-ligase [Deltaproteobacteria bacterium]|nr:phosphoribosylformylglycinamidine cyclo-ligase [Deltaproteobacteria bacterium]